MAWLLVGGDACCLCCCCGCPGYLLVAIKSRNVFAKEKRREEKRENEIEQNITYLRFHPTSCIVVYLLSCHCSAGVDGWV